jgi:hypothetical protein
MILFLVAGFSMAQEEEESTKHLMICGGHYGDPEYKKEVLSISIHEYDPSFLFAHTLEVAVENLSSFSIRQNFGYEMAHSISNMP